MGKRWKPIGNNQGIAMSKTMKTHGFASGYNGYVGAEHPVYTTWRHMKERCYKEKDPAYKNYGGRGIKVCDEWLGLSGSTNFCNWAINNGWQEGLTLDRIDNEGNYEPSNCRWITKKEQNRNRRSNRLVTMYGKTMCLTDAIELYGNGMKLGTVLYRLKNGYSLADALTRPLMGGKH